MTPDEKIVVGGAVAALLLMYLEQQSSAQNVQVALTVNGQSGAAPSNIAVNNSIINAASATASTSAAPTGTVVAAPSPAPAVATNTTIMDGSKLMGGIQIGVTATFSIQPGQCLAFKFNPAVQSYGMIYAGYPNTQANLIASLSATPGDMSGPYGLGLSGQVNWTTISNGHASQKPLVPGVNYYANIQLAPGSQACTFYLTL